MAFVMLGKCQLVSSTFPRRPHIPTTPVRGIRVSSLVPREQLRLRPPPLLLLFLLHYAATGCPSFYRHHNCTGSTS